VIVMTDRVSEKRFRSLSRFSQYTSALTIGFGLMVLTGWIFHIQRLKGLMAGQVAVKANTAVCFVLIGLALWVGVGAVHKRSMTVLARAAALMAAFIGLLSFLEYWNGWDLGIDQLLFKAGPEDAPGSVRPGLMSPIAALDFFLLGITLIVFDLQAGWSRLLQNLLPAVAAVSAMFGVLDFVLDPQDTHTHIAPLTALILLLCSLALLCGRTQGGLGALLISDTVAGLLCRRLLPAAILIPVVIGWLRWRGQQMGLYSEWTGLAIMTVSAAVLLAGLTVWTAVVLDRIEIERQHAEKSARYLAAIVNSSNDGIIGKTVDGVVTSWNPGAEIIYGYSAEEMVGRPLRCVVPPERLDEFQEFLYRVSHGEIIQHHETERIRKDGKRIFVSISISPVKDEDGNVVALSTIARDIAERKRADEELRRAACYSRSLIEATLDALVTISKDGKITDVNEATEKATGISRDHLIGSDFCDYFTEPQKAREGYQQVFEKGFIRDYELAIRSVSGKAMEVLYNATVFKGAGGEVEGVLAAARDITARKQAESALKDSENNFRTLANFVPQLVWICKPDGLNVYFNQRWFDYTGLTPEQSYGRNWSTPFHPDDQQAACAAWNHAVASGDSYSVESRLCAADGNYRWFLIRGVPVRDEAGNIVRWFGTCTDVDEMKRAASQIRELNRDLEKRVEQRTAELKASEERVRRKLDAILMPAGDLAHLTLADVLDTPILKSLLEDFHQLTRIPLAIIDLEGTTLIGTGWQDICTRFHRVHPITCTNCLESDTLLSRGVAPGEFKLYQCRNSMWDGVTPISVGGQHLGNIFLGQFFFANQKIDHELFREQARRYGFDEKEYLSALDRVPRFTPEQIDSGSRFLAKFAQLLSQLSYSSIKLARSSEQVSRTNMELSATVKELEAFTYSVSHDLRAPLRHISGFSKILTEEFAANLPSEAQHHLQRIQEGTRRMGQLVDDLLNLSRVGRKELSLQVAGLRSIVEEVIATLKPEVGDRRVEWKIGDLPYVECDTALMQQVFQNLLSNALKFTKPRALAVIEIGQELHDERSLVYVRDNGVGFSMKYADKLFGVFQRLHRAEDFEGTGVGLATVQRIIQKHGGRIWAEAELDKGASFYFTVGTSETFGEKTKAIAVGENHA
jgi:PAS domain S-box-containing protein